SSAVHSFSWSPGGDSLLIQGPSEAWWHFTPGGSATRLTFKAAWASSLASGLGFIYIDDAGVLHRQDANGDDEVVSADVAEAAVSPSGLRVAFINAKGNLNEIWGYDVGLLARYDPLLASAPVTAVPCAPEAHHTGQLGRDLATPSFPVPRL